MREFISHVIGDEYKEWKPRNIVFLTAPTGSGKTFFVLNKLVKYIESKKNSKILYLVNRKILKEQIKNTIDVDIRPKIKNIDEIITVKTYQELETPYGRKKYDDCSKYNTIIADECHYFFSDSTYNPHTCISYDWVMDRRKSALLVFISATVDRIEEYILNDIEPKEPDPEITEDWEPSQIQVRTYDTEADYSHVDIHILEGIDSISDIIKEKKGKWMVFVDSIKKGRNIHRSLKNSGIDAVFIESKWVDSYDELILDTVGNMVKEQKFGDKQVVIATSVIDNGVSIHDMELRNLVIMADTKEQFIQMLGRKRVDYNKDEKPKRINLYILKSNKKTFKRRMLDAENNLACIAKYYNEDDNSYQILKKIQKYPEWGRCFRRICYIKEDLYEYGSMILNKFSYEQYEYLRHNYMDIIKRFDDEDEYAFIRQQAEWIGINNIEEIINTQRTSLKDKVKNIIDEYTGEKLTPEKNVELREKIRIDLRTLLEECETYDPEDEYMKNTIKDLGKISNKEDEKPRKMSKKRFNWIMSKLAMEYRIEGNMINVISMNAKSRENSINQGTQTT